MSSPENEDVIPEAAPPSAVTQAQQLSPSASTTSLQLKSSWSSIVQNNNSLRHHNLNFSETEGAPVVEIPDDIIEDSPPLWEDFLVGKFLSKAPHVGKVHVIINKIWPLGDKTAQIDTFVVNDFTIKFRIRDRATRSRVLHRHMWNIAGVPMYISKWSPIVEEAQPTMNSVPLWVVMKHVPHKMFSWKGLGFLASAVGKPTKLHPDTETCKSFEEAKVSVLADLSKDLPKSFRFKSAKGVDSTVEFIYPWLPERCKTCSNWGHKMEACLAGEKRMQDKGKVAGKTLYNKDGKAKEQGETIETEEILFTQDAHPVVMEVKQNANKEVEIEHCETERCEAGPLTIPPGEASTVTTKEGEWHKVSPTKQGRQPIEMGDQNGTLSSASKFSVLAEQDETEDEVEGENQEVMENIEREETEISDEQRPLVDSSTQKRRKARKKIVSDESGSRPCLPRISKSSHKIIQGSRTQAAGGNGSPQKH